MAIIILSNKLFFFFFSYFDMALQINVKYVLLFGVQGVANAKITLIN